MNNKFVFRNKVLEVVRRIKKGETLTYKKVAESAGHAKAYRAVGNILNKNYDPKIPCHRVIRSDGSFGGYNRGKKIKEELLKKENTLINLGIENSKIKSNVKIWN